MRTSTWALALALLAEGFFSGSEIGVVSADKMKLRHDAAKPIEYDRAFVVERFRAGSRTASRYDQIAHLHKKMHFVAKPFYMATEIRVGPLPLPHAQKSIIISPAHHEHLKGFRVLLDRRKQSKMVVRACSSSR